MLIQHNETKNPTQNNEVTSSTSYSYDVNNLRTVKDDSPGPGMNDTSSRFVYDGDNILYEADTTGAMTKFYLNNIMINGYEAEISTSVCVYIKDALGSIRGDYYDQAIEVPTVSGGTVQSPYRLYSYSAFGEPLEVDSGISTKKDGISYTGQYFDTESSLYYCRAREYDPSSGRFLSRDGIQDPSKRYSPAGLQCYVYGINNPVRYTDPTGRDSVTDWLFGSNSLFGQATKAVGNAISGIGQFLYNNREVFEGIGIALAVCGLVAASIVTCGGAAALAAGASAAAAAGATLGAASLATASVMTGLLSAACIGGAIGMAGGAISAGMSGQDIMVGGLIGGAVGFLAGGLGAAVGGAIGGGLLGSSLGGATSGFANGFGNAMVGNLEAGQNIGDALGNSLVAGGEGALSGAMGGFFGGLSGSIGDASGGINGARLGGSILTGAVGGGFVGMLSAGLSGRDLGRGFLGGLASGAIGGAVGYLNVSANPAMSALIGGGTGALAAGAMTALGGGSCAEIEESMINGGIGGAIGGYNAGYQRQQAQAEEGMKSNQPSMSPEVAGRNAHDNEVLYNQVAEMNTRLYGGYGNSSMADESANWAYNQSQYGPMNEQQQIDFDNTMFVINQDRRAEASYYAGDNLLASQNTTRTASMYQPKAGGPFNQGGDHVTWCNMSTFDVIEATGGNIDYYVKKGTVTTTDSASHNRWSTGANQSNDVIQQNVQAGNLVKVTPEQAQILANEGYTVVASWKNPQADSPGYNPGHMSTVMASEDVYNPTLGPKVSNVGGFNGERSVRNAFNIGSPGEASSMSDIGFYYEPSQKFKYDPSKLVRTEAVLR